MIIGFFLWVGLFCGWGSKVWVEALGGFEVLAGCWVVFAAEILFGNSSGVVGFGIVGVDLDCFVEVS